MLPEGRVVAGMAGLRLISATIETTAALLMLRFGKVETAVRINGALGLVGPTILILVSLLGVAGLAGKVPAHKLAMIVAGVLLILLGAR